MSAVQYSLGKYCFLSLGPPEELPSCLLLFAFTQYWNHPEKKIFPIVTLHVRLSSRVESPFREPDQMLSLENPPSPRRHQALFFSLSVTHSTFWLVLVQHHPFHPFLHLRVREDDSSSQSAFHGRPTQKPCIPLISRAIVAQRCPSI